MNKINVAFSTIDTAELSANLPNEFSTPDISATTDIHKRYGNMICVSRIASANFSGLSLKPGANKYISHGMATMPTTVTIASTNNSPASASSANACAESRPSPSMRLANSGMNAELNAPSPNNRRNRLGIRKPTLNASATSPDPNAQANRISRPKPSTRLMIVSPPTVKNAR